jgi:hypothetical protein
MAYPPQHGPQKNRAPLFATLTFVVALLAGVGVLGFVEPAFFLSDDEGTSSSGGTASEDSKDSTESGAPFPGAGGGAPAGDGGDSDAESAPAPKTGDSPGDGGASGDGEAFVQEFVSALNDLDSTTANAMYCPDAVGGMVDYVIKKGPELAVDTAESSEYYLKVTLSGTLGSEPLRSGKLSVKLSGGGAPCVFTFTAS